MNEQQFSPDRKNNIYIDFAGAVERIHERIADSEKAQSGLSCILYDAVQLDGAWVVVDRSARGLGNVLVPWDLSTGKPNHEPRDVAAATARGVLIGWSLCEDQLCDARIDPEILVPKVPGNLVVSPDKVPELRNQADNYIKLSGHGLALMDPNTQGIVESWIDEVTPQIDRQIYTKTGLGIFLHNANSKLQECDARKMEYEANAGVSWDDLLDYCQENPEN